MPGIPGQYFIQFGLTVAFSVFFSLLVARLITPMMAAYLMRAEDAMDDHIDNDGLFMRGYTRVVRATTGGWAPAPLRRWGTEVQQARENSTSAVGKFVHFMFARVGFGWVSRLMTLAAAIAFLIGSLMLLAQVPGSFLPPEDAGRISLSVELPPNATLEETERKTDEIYAAIKDVSDVSSIFILGGASPKGDLELRRASVTMNLDRIEHSLVKTLVNKGLGGLPLIGQYLPKMEEHGRERPQWDIEEEVFEKLASVADIRVLKLNDRGERDISFNFLSKNEDELNQAVAILESKLRAVPALSNVSSEGALPRPGTADPPARRRGGPPRYHCAADLSDDPRRHHRRRRRCPAENLAR